MEYDPFFFVTTNLFRDNKEQWNIQEDQALLKSVQQLSGMGVGRTVNWDLIADMVSEVSHTIRSASQCRTRYEKTTLQGKSELLPEDEQRKNSTNMVLKKLSTCQLDMHDNNISFTEAFHRRFDNITSLSRPTFIKRHLPSNRSLKEKQIHKVLKELGIAYDSPLDPVEIARRRDVWTDNEIMEEEILDFDDLATSHLKLLCWLSDSPAVAAAAFKKRLEEE